MNYKEVKPELSNKEEIVLKLFRLFNLSIKQIKGPVSIAFSGGVDSSSIAYLLNQNKVSFRLYNVGFSSSKDFLSANITAKKESWPLTNICLDNVDIEKLAKEVIRLTKRCDPITVGVGIVTLLVAKHSKEDVIVSGLGSEELFAGYERHKYNVHEECVKGLETIEERDIKRDKTICKAYNKKIIFPFLDNNLTIYALKIIPDLKIGKYKKQIFRDTMFENGLPEYISYRKKSAAQYGSKVDHAIEKLAKNKSLKKSEYLQSLLD